MIKTLSAALLLSLISLSSFASDIPAELRTDLSQKIIDSCYEDTVAIRALKNAKTSSDKLRLKNLAAIDDKKHLSDTPAQHARDCLRQIDEQRADDRAAQPAKAPPAISDKGWRRGSNKGLH